MRATRVAAITTTAVAVTLGLTGVAVAGNTTHPASVGGQCRLVGTSNECHYYNAMAQEATGTGASVTFTVAQPKVGVKDVHSRVVLRVESKDRKQAVEIGSVVRRSPYHDSYPHLFIESWVNGTPRYIAHYVQLSQSVNQGMQLTPGRTATVSIQFTAGHWLLSYNGTAFGYFKAKSWQGKFTKVARVRVFADVASTDPAKPHSQMGNGVLGTKPHAAVIKNAKLIGGKPTTPWLYDDREAPAVYKIGNVNRACKTNCSMTFGGPGY